MRTDSNGYAPSIIPDHDKFRCKLCGRNGSLDPLNRHEIFGGPNRSKSKKLGLWVYLCHHRCHQGPQGVHNNSKAAINLKQEAQLAAMNKYGWNFDDFIREFGKNYI